MESSIHSNPMGFASKCVEYANILDVGRLDIGDPVNRMALFLSEGSVPYS